MSIQNDYQINPLVITLIPDSELETFEHRLMPKDSFKQNAEEGVTSVNIVVTDNGVRIGECQGFYYTCVGDKTALIMNSFAYRSNSIALDLRIYCSMLDWYKNYANTQGHLFTLTTLKKNQPDTLLMESALNICGYHQEVGRTFPDFTTYVCLNPAFANGI
jgi:hypothetical protein